MWLILILPRKGGIMKITLILITLTILITLSTIAIATKAKAAEFNVLDYNNALTEYHQGKYAQAYNTLLDSNAPKAAYKAIFNINVK
jgi:hypothetical protein